uniref:Transmembrane protein 254 n=1 Tax=Sinocyclocheilus rhinocerous TaxID=307959 RepID=A0A673FR19_9TELE
MCSPEVKKRTHPNLGWSQDVFSTCSFLAELISVWRVCVCSDKGIDSTSTRLLWFAQTFLFGFASLGLLVKYKPDGRPKRQ